MPGFPAAQVVDGLRRTVVALVRERPLLVAGGALAGLIVLVVAVWLLRRRLRTPGERFERVLAEPDAVTILLHPNPDPDALAAGMGIAFLAEQVGTTAILQYPGEIRHPENRAFRTVLDVTCDSIEDLTELVDDPVILVDHNEPRGIAGSSGIDPYAVIDHHPGGGTGSAFTDVRPDVGACATIVAEYLEDLGFEPDANEEEATNTDERLLPSRVATGLLYGILADTDHLTRGCAPADFAASSYLFPGIDQDALDRIAHPQIDAELLDVRAAAISGRDVRGPYAVSDVGTVSNVDAIPQAADELLDLEGVTAVVVFGQKNDTIHLSGRSRDDRLHMGDVLAAAVEDIPMSDAGGHARMGGGQISVAHFEGLRPDSGMTHEELIDHLFEAMTGER